MDGDLWWLSLLSMLLVSSTGWTDSMAWLVAGGFTSTTAAVDVASETDVA
jgi:hypothetical protein